MNRTLSGDVRFSGGELEISQCVWCRHRSAGGRTCEAFPEGIPRIVAGNHHDHRLPFKGDQGVRFEPEVLNIESVDVGSEADSVAPTAEFAIAMARGTGEPEAVVGPDDLKEAADNIIALQGVDFELEDDEFDLEVGASVR